MNLNETAASPLRVPVPPGVSERATELIREFAECFWFRHPDACVRYTDDVELVIEHLREYGDRRAWEAAKELRRCL